MRPSHLVLAASCAAAAAQLPRELTPEPRIDPPQMGVDCPAKTAIEFISPMPGEEVPVYHAALPGQSWHVILELALEQTATQQTGVLEAQYIPAPGFVAMPPTDVNVDGIVGDPHPAIPGLTVTMDDGLTVNGFFLPPGTNLASLFEMIGSEIEHGGDQSTTLTWVVTPMPYMIIDLNGDAATNLNATINGVTDLIYVRHGFDPVYAPCSLQSTPTVSIFTPDWISTVDELVNPGDGHTPFLVGVEVRIPCWFDNRTNPPTPTPLDPIPGPGGAGMAGTGNFPGVPGPGGHPQYPTLDVRFSDSYIDGNGTIFVPGGVITGGTCATIWGATGANLAFAFEQSSVQSWYGVDGIPNLMPVLADDQMIYRFTMIGDGTILDTDQTPGEMLITATIETECNVFSITNVRVKHHPEVITPDPEQ